MHSVVFFPSFEMFREGQTSIHKYERLRETMRWA